MFVLIAKRAQCQLYNLSNFIAPGSGKIAFAIEANFSTCCYLLQNQEILFLLAGCYDGKEQVTCVFILDINTTTSVLITWNKTIQWGRGKSMHLTYKIPGNDSYIVTVKWHNGLLCGRKTACWILPKLVHFKLSNCINILWKYCPFWLRFCLTSFFAFLVINGTYYMWLTFKYLFSNGPYVYPGKHLFRFY